MTEKRLSPAIRLSAFYAYTAMAFLGAVITIVNATQGPLADHYGVASNRISLMISCLGIGRLVIQILCGALSGAVEPIGGAATALFAAALAPTLPWLLSFAAGAMISVVIGELVPDRRGEGGHGGEMCFAAGFALMMALDVGMG